MGTITEGKLSILPLVCKLPPLAYDPGASATPNSGNRGPHKGPAPEDKNPDKLTSSEGAQQPDCIYEILFIFVLMGKVQCQNIWFMSHANYSWEGGGAGGGKGVRHQEEQQKEACSKRIMLRWLP